MLRFWLKERFFSLVRLLVNPLIKYEIEFEEGFTKEELRKKKPIYAIPEYSVSELIALEKFASESNINSPLDKFKGYNFQNFISLQRPRFDISEQKVKRFSPKNLDQLLITGGEAYILPVSFYWGMHPDKQRSFFKILFSQSWAVSGPIKKFFRILLHGRSLVIKFNKPLDLSEIKERERTNEENSRLISRYLRGIFRKTKQASIGPDISHRRTLVRSLTKDIDIRKEIKKQSKGNKRKKKRLNKKAFNYANEICSDINYPIVRNLQRGLSWFWNTRYEGIEVKNLERIKSIADDNSLVYVPCHRSHIDYLALSYILLEKGLMLPHVAAGINLNLPILGGILRGGGAFFMRRSFVKNKLYSLIFFQYFRRLLQRGSSIEFFPEGGRSRNGFSVKARPGLLSMTIRSFSTLTNENVKLVPTYIGYEKIIEGNSYISELLGHRKKRESLIDIFKSLRDFGNFLGNAYINFGKPIDLKSFLENEIGSKEFAIDSPLDRPEWLKGATNKLGSEIMRSINSSSVVTSSSIFALSLLTESTQSLEIGSLKKRISLFISLLQQNKNYSDIWLPDTDSEKIIKKTEELKLIRSELMGGAKVFRPDQKQAALLSYYQNNISHLFLLYSVICLSLKYAKKLSIDEIERLCSIVYPFLKSDYYLPWEEPELKRLINDCITILKKHQLVTSLKDGYFSRPEAGSNKYLDFVAITNISEPSIKRFYVVMSIVWNSQKVDVHRLRERCYQTSTELKKLEGWIYNEFNDKSKFDSFINKLLEDRYLKANKDGTLSASLVTNNVQKDFVNFFNKDFMNQVNQLDSV